MPEAVNRCFIICCLPHSMSARVSFHEKLFIGDTSSLIQGISLKSLELTRNCSLLNEAGLSSGSFMRFWNSSVKTSSET
jgi:hypothetical protein